MICDICGKFFNITTDSNICATCKNKFTNPTESNSSGCSVKPTVMRNSCLITTVGDLRSFISQFGDAMPIKFNGILNRINYDVDKNGVGFLYFEE